MIPYQLHELKSKQIRCKEEEEEEDGEEEEKTKKNLSHTVNFATRIQNDSSTANNNIFVDNSKLKSFYTSPLIKCLSNHDAQFLTINNIYATTK
jgi:hypothetical protein